MMGCDCGKKKGAVSVFSTEEQSRIAKERSVRVLTSAGSSNGKKTKTTGTNS
jgi:hypothetical protein